MELATRDRLVRGARVALVKHGLRGLTVEHVLQAADLSRRTFYQHFSGRDELLVAVFDHEVARLVHTLQARVVSTDRPIVALHAGIEAYLDFQVEGGRLLALLQAEASNPDSSLHVARERVFDVIVALVEMHIRSLYARPIDPLVHRSLFLALEGLVLHLRRGGALTTADRDRAAAVMKPVFTATLLAVDHLPSPPDE